MPPPELSESPGTSEGPPAAKRMAPGTTAKKRARDAEPDTTVKPPKATVMATGTVLRKSFEMSWPTRLTTAMATASCRLRTSGKPMWEESTNEEH